MRTRRATPKDFHEILRLAHLLWTDMGIPGNNGDWETLAHDFFASSLDSDRLNAFVAEHPIESDRLIACGIGVVQSQMPAFWLPDGQMGYVQWFSTESEFRRQGLATEILDRLIEWFTTLGIMRIQLHASQDALSVYQRAGFVDTSHANLWLRT